MGIYDRDYLRDEGRPRFAAVTGSALGNVVILTAAIWLAQLILRSPFGTADATVSALGLSGQDLFGGSFPRVWSALTATFAHDVWRPSHIAFNLVFLVVFGRAFEAEYGRRTFVLFHVVAGALAAMAEAVSLQRLGAPNVEVIGASGSVMGFLAVFVLLGPTNPVDLILFRCPRWLVGALFLAADLRGVASPSPEGVAHLAHLTGAGVGLGFVHFLAPKCRPARPRTRARAAAASTPRRGAPAVAEHDRVRDRIDGLLEKISRVGVDGLDAEEMRFLRDHSQSYRR